MPTTGTAAEVLNEGSDEAAFGALDPTDLPVDEWAVSVIESYEEFQLARSGASTGWVEASIAEDDEIDKAVEFLETEYNAVREFLTQLPGQPTTQDDASSSYAQLVASAININESNRALLALVTTAPDDIRAAIEEAGNPGPTEYGQAFSDHWALDDQLLRSCSVLQSDLTEFGILDCASSTVEPGDLGETEGIDPTITPTGGVRWARLAPGSYDFKVFRPGLSLDLDEPVLVETGLESLVFRDPDDEAVEFWLFDAPNWADPDRLASFDEAFAAVPIPQGDVESYLQRLPVIIVESGTLDVGDLNINYWDLVVDAEAATFQLEFPEFSLLRLGDEPTAPQILLFADSTHRVMMWDNGGPHPTTAWSLSSNEQEAEANAAFFVSVMDETQ